MSWWSILKLDIEVYVDKLKEDDLLTSIAHYHADADTIRVSLPRLKRELTRMLGKEPTDKQLERAYAQVLAHESGHAADIGPKGARRKKLEETVNIINDDKPVEVGAYLDARQDYDSMMEDGEFIAFLNQFGENVFSGINRFLQHPAVREIDYKKVKEKNIPRLFAGGITKVRDRFNYLEKLIRWAGGTTSKNKLRNELVRLELAVAKKFKGKMKTNFPINSSQARARYKDFDGKVMPKAGSIINQVWGKGK